MAGKNVMRASVPVTFMWNFISQELLDQFQPNLMYKVTPVLYAMKISDIG